MLHVCVRTFDVMGTVENFLCTSSPKSYLLAILRVFVSLAKKKRLIQYIKTLPRTKRHANRVVVDAKHKIFEAGRPGRKVFRPRTEYSRTYLFSWGVFLEWAGWNTERVLRANNQPPKRKYCNLTAYLFTSVCIQDSRHNNAFQITSVCCLDSLVAFGSLVLIRVEKSNAYLRRF